MPSSWASTLWMGVFVWGVVINGQQRTVPGVNPNQYQGGQGHPPPPPPPQQQQQHQPHQQQQFAQQAQAPQQAQFVQQAQQFAGPPHTGQAPPGQPFQQPPPQQPMAPAPGGGGHHAHGGAPQRVLHRDVKHEREHMKEHMDVPIDTSNMSEEELQFHYFKMHDADGNNKLDGCELVKSLIHWHDEANHDPKAGQPIPEAKIFKDDELVNMIDPILSTDDKNLDGYIDYPEFVQAQKAAQAKAATQ